MLFPQNELKVRVNMQRKWIYRTLNLVKKMIWRKNTKKCHNRYDSSSFHGDNTKQPVCQIGWKSDKNFSRYLAIPTVTISESRKWLRHVMPQWRHVSSKSILILKTTHSKMNVLSSKTDPVKIRQLQPELNIENPWKAKTSFLPFRKVEPNLKSRKQLEFQHRANVANVGNFSGCGNSL